MKKFLLTLGFMFVAVTLVAKPYFAKYRDHQGNLFIFYGNIRDEDEPEVLLRQSQYVEALYTPLAGSHELDLQKLGVSIKIIAHSQVPLEDIESYYPAGSVPSTAPSQS